MATSRPRGPERRAGRRRRSGGRCGCCGSAASTSRPTSRRHAATGAASSSNARERSGSYSADARSGSRSSTSPIGSRPAGRAACCRWRSRATTRARGASTSTTPTSRASSRSTSSGRPRRPNRADPDSRRSVIRVPHPRCNHKGGQLQVGADGMLYAGFGDGGGGGDPDENAQNLSRMLGKMIRIDPRPNGGYSVPATTRSAAARAPGRRYTPTAYETRTASRSIVVGAA